MIEKDNTIYDNISLKELREIVESDKEKFALIKIGWFDGWRWALYAKGAIITARLLEKSDKEV